MIFCNTCLTALLCSSDRRYLIPGGDRTHDLWVRSPTRYPLRYRDFYRCGIRLYDVQFVNGRKKNKMLIDNTARGLVWLKRGRKNRDHFLQTVQLVKHGAVQLHREHLNVECQGEREDLSAQGEESMKS
ncbi:hypothetical protein T01_15178 [Trichinella spiralis]|uniref:Uncharacterized protein n=1 Tax=Trichinella spiralis TaxID=6334 RepID=A0A0V1BQV1_TRISP|nr:hypothetical protein T01_15178 [Trichinella spiralis]